jgi:NTE family protein
VGEVDLGWDARGADIVVGTSAGSLTGTMLRVGTSPFDLASWILGRPWSPDQTLLDGLDSLRSGLPLVQLRTLLRPWHIPALGMTRSLNLQNTVIPSAGYHQGTCSDLLHQL